MQSERKTTRRPCDPMRTDACEPQQFCQSDIDRFPNNGQHSNLPCKKLLLFSYNRKSVKKQRKKENFNFCWKFPNNGYLGRNSFLVEFRNPR